MHTKTNEKFKNQITNSFMDILNFLIKYQNEIWDNAKEGTAAFYIINIKKANDVYNPLNIIYLKRQVASARYFVPEILYKRFICEYEKTIVLMDKILIKALAENKIGLQKEERMKVNNLMEKLALTKEEIENMELVLFHLRKAEESKRLTGIIDENKMEADTLHQ